MKRGARPGYVLRQSWLLLEQSPWLAAVSALTVALALTLVGLFAMVLFNANRLLHELGRQMTVSVYLHESATQAEIDALTKVVRARPGVKAVRTLSAEQDRERNKKLLDPKLLEGLDESAIPGQPVLEVELEEELGSRGDVDQLLTWTQSLKSVAAVDSAEFGADKLRVLFAGVEIVRTVGALLSLVLLASAMFFVFSTIRLAVFSRRDEIEILSLIGATPGFIRLPFLVEGALQGLAGAVLAMGLLGILHLELRGLLHDVYRLNVQTLLPPGMVVWLLVGGPMVSVTASAVSIGRYLRT